MFTEKIEIDKSKCIGCKKCYEACYENVYLFDEAEKKPVAAYPESCQACYLCELYCPAKCIDVFPKQKTALVDPFTP